MMGVNRLGERWSRKYIVIRHYSSEQSRPEAGSGIDYAALAEFRRALREFVAFSATAARVEGLAPQQHQAILAIRGAPGAELSVGDLAAALLIRPNTAQELAGRLIRAGLVTRVGDPADRRRVVLRLTAQAEAVLSRLSVAHTAELRRRRILLRDLLDRLEG
jgi:DNA-binding MarR family transcriptional regulator